MTDPQRQLIEEIRKLDAAAKPDRWAAGVRIAETATDPESYAVIVGPRQVPVGRSWAFTPEDGLLIVALRNNIGALLALIEAQDKVWKHCRVVFYPEDGQYPIEHVPGVKDGREAIEAALAARGDEGKRTVEL